MALNIGPLKELTVMTGVAYLSDLQWISYDLVRRQLCNIKSERYTVFQWKDAAEYLTGNATDFSSAEEIYEYILTYAGSRK